MVTNSKRIIPAIAADHRERSIVFICFGACLQALLGKDPRVLVTDPWGRETDTASEYYYSVIFHFLYQTVCLELLLSAQKQRFQRACINYRLVLLYDSDLACDKGLL